MGKLKLIFFLTIILTTGCSKDFGKKDNIEKLENIVEINKEVDEVKSLIKDLTLEEKIGQLMIVGINSKTFNEEVKEKINTLKPSGFIFFSKDITDYNGTREFVNEIKFHNKNNKVPVFLSIDEEGGRVSRIPKEIDKIPEASVIGSINDYKKIYEIGKHLGKSIGSLGFNFNLAPVMDINSNTKNQVIGRRAYGNEKIGVYKVGKNIVKGMNDMKIISCIKHFPGHGDTIKDSHKSLPVVNKTLSQLEDNELYPFIKLIDKEIDSIMVAHILYPYLDNDEPSSLSFKIKEDLLRRRYGYKGVIVSDDMTMGAISNDYNVVDASVKFIKTGGDLVLLCHGDDLGYKFKEKMMEELKQGNILEEDIDEKIYRILSLKNKYKLKDIETKSIDIGELNRELEKLLKEEEK